MAKTTLYRYHWTKEATIKVYKDLACTIAAGTLKRSQCTNFSFYVDKKDGDDKRKVYRLSNPGMYGLPDPSYIPVTAYVKEGFYEVETNTDDPNSSSATTTIKDETSVNLSLGIDQYLKKLASDQKWDPELYKRIRMWGAPYRFLPHVDMVNDTNWNIGVSYIKNMLLELPILTLIPGVPTYMPGQKDDTKKLIEQYVIAKANNHGVPDAVTKAINGLEMRYYDFVSAFPQYMKYVNILCRVCSLYMGLGDRTVPNTDGNTREVYKSYDYERYLDNTKVAKVDIGKGIAAARNDKLGSWVQSTFDAGWEQLKTEFEDVLHNRYRGTNFVIDPSSSFSESMSNSTSQAPLAGIFESAADIVSTAHFLTAGAGDLLWLTKAMEGTLNGAVNAGKFLAMDSDANMGYTKLLGMMGHIISGSKVQFPEIWTDFNYSKSYSITINLISPYGDSESIFLNIMVPLMFILGFVFPRMTSANSYISPFLVKGFARGLYTCDMGIIDGLNIEKVTSSISRTGLPTEVKVSFTIKELYTQLSMASSKESSLFVSNQALIEWLSVFCGLDIMANQAMTKITTLVNSFLTNIEETLSDKITEFTQWASRQGLFRLIADAYAVYDGVKKDGELPGRNIHVPEEGKDGSKVVI